MRASGATPLALASLAVAAGAAFLWNVGALPGMATRNIAAFGIGLAIGWAAHRLAFRNHGAAVLFAIGTTILALVLIAGIEMDGVRRWLDLGPAVVQPALILSPLLLAIVASREGRHWRVAILLPVLLVALQPDAASMLALTAGVAALMAGASGLSRRGWTGRRLAIMASAIGVAVLALVFSGIQTPPPVAFVEGTVGLALLSGPFAGMLHFAAIALMIAALLSRADPAGLALAAYFTVAALAAVFWAFPMPVAGAGPSHLIGFGIAAGWLATHRHRHGTVERLN
jgi:cell division protein FtsW (lipid II flippase)